MDGKRSTIRDVAQRARVSESTVSRVLGGSATAIPISEKTRQRVFTAARELNYSPNPFARALRGKGTKLLGLIVREIDDPFFARLIEVMSRVANQKGYDLMLGCARSDPQQALTLSKILDTRRCDGLFLVGDLKESPDDHTLLARMSRAHPLVSVCRGGSQLLGSSPSVAVDNRKGVLMALDYLVRLGHQRIGLLAEPSRLGDLQERAEAYFDFVRERLGQSCEEYAQWDRNSYAGGYAAMKKLLSLSPRPTAVIAADDTIAVGALKAISDVGFEVPGDVSVIGFDDIEIASYLRPALTTIRQPIERIGEKAVDLLLERVTGEAPATPRHLLMEPELVIRDSCGPPRE